MAKLTLLDEVTEARIREVSDCIAEAVHPEAIILFGSHARGDARSASDVDLAIVLPDSLASKHDARLAMTMALRSFLFPIDILAYRRSEFDARRTRPHGFVHNLVAEGKVLYGHI
jgi:predicted nucleotidyltransferase